MSERGWTVDTLREYLLAKIDGNRRLYMEKFAASDKAVASALGVEERATKRAEDVIEKKLAGVNELRAMALDSGKAAAERERLTMPRLEQERINDALKEKIDGHETRLNQLRDLNSGKRELWGWIVGVVGILLAIVSYLTKKP